MKALYNQESEKCLLRMTVCSRESQSVLLTYNWSSLPSSPSQSFRVMRFGWVSFLYKHNSPLHCTLKMRADRILWPSFESLIPSSILRKIRPTHLSRTSTNGSQFHLGSWIHRRSSFNRRRNQEFESWWQSRVSIHYLLWNLFLLQEG